VFVVRMTEEQCSVDQSRDVMTTSTSLQCLNIHSLYQRVGCLLVVVITII
jgi:hypothetical protein